MDGKKEEGMTGVLLFFSILLESIVIFLVFTPLRLRRDLKLKLFFILNLSLITTHIWLKLWLLVLFWTAALGFLVYELVAHREKMRIPVKSVLLLSVVFIVLIFPSSTVLHQVKTEVGIIKNINEDGWYWTQFQLPSGGELMAKASLEEYLYWRDLDLSRVDILGLTPFFGRFCPCGETIPNKYVFLPLQNPEDSMLTFFSDDGKTVWEIEVPEELQTPERGELTTQATIYYH
ncbi:MAG: hypothetical protein MUP45_02210 [Candidatus Marinimicrobia bacterium]|nr:hypothetical protein [Candidatus Neomarinimicrobiota bacterium]